MVTSDGLLALVFSVLLCRLRLQPRLDFPLEEARKPSRLNGEGRGGGGEVGGPTGGGPAPSDDLFTPF